MLVFQVSIPHFLPKKFKIMQLVIFFISVDETFEKTNIVAKLMKMTLVKSLHSSDNVFVLMLVYLLTNIFLFLYFYIYLRYIF